MSSSETFKASVKLSKSQTAMPFKEFRNKC